jgi:F-type H+-transporting ATPase subunit delta
MLKNLNTVIENKDIKNILLNDSFDYKYKTSFINDVLKEGIDENFMRFIAILAENNRLSVISEVVGLYDSYLQEEKSLKTAKIDTAFELSIDQLDSIKAVLEKRFNKKIEIEQNLNSSLLAGAVVRIDDLVIDGSLREQLRKLESQLI